MVKCREVLLKKVFNFIFTCAVVDCGKYNKSNINTNLKNMRFKLSRITRYYTVVIKQKIKI